jgi:hypothetical protein
LPSFFEQWTRYSFLTMIVIRKYPVRVAQVWFDAPASLTGVDALEFVQCSTPPAPHSIVLGSLRDFYSLAIDLAQGEEQIRKNLKKDARAAIVRTEAQDKPQFDLFQTPSLQLIEGFKSFHDQAARFMGREDLSLRLLKNYASAKSLTLSRLRDQNGKTLSWHSYIVAQGRARLLNSASAFREMTTAADRSLLGRSHRYHHWLDILAFKEAGLRSYDLGGWYEGDTDQERLKINHFKEEFGGEKVRTYNYRISCSGRGKAYEFLKKIRSS